MSIYKTPIFPIIKPDADSALGIATAIFNLKNVNIVNSKNPYPDQTLNYTRDTPATNGLQNTLSVLGTAVYSDLSLMGCSWSDTSKAPTYQGAQGPSSTPVYPKTSLYKPPANPDSDDITKTVFINLQTVIITVDQPYEIVETKIQGRNGTVKEYIGKGDSIVTIQGIITGANGVYPRQTVKDLKDWCDAPIAKNITAWWLENLGISSIVVKSVNIPQVAGGYSYQSFSISAVSDTPVTFNVTSPPGTVSPV